MNKLKTESSTSIEAYLADLYGRINYERQDRMTPRHFKLRNMREILRRLDDPHLRYPVVHIAGTKGKGSVATMVGQILTESGRRTGVYTSPHLETIHQRMVIDGSLITDQQLVETLSSMDPVIRAMDEEADRQDHRLLTFFEITTAAALQFFAKQNCEAVVLEVGMGGRLDSTNVCQPVTSVITNISIDHTRQLGATVDKIAFEKAGIIKPTVPVVSGATDPEAARVIAEVAFNNQSPLFQLERDFSFTETDAEGTFSSRGEMQLPRLDDEASEQNFSQHRFELHDLRLSLIGHHQRTNASVAIAAIETLNARGWNISEQSIRRGLRQANLSGRTELVSTNPTVILDMAHNVASIEALVEALMHDLPEWKTAEERTLILATSRDKDAVGMLRPLVKAFDRIILTKYQDNPRGKSETELLKVASELQSELAKSGQTGATLMTSPDPQSAWNQATQSLGPGKLVCISGSAFLVAELRKTVLNAVAIA